jgi:hypothetical protein
LLFQSSFGGRNAIADYTGSKPSPWPAELPPQTLHEKFFPPFIRESVPPISNPTLDLPFCPSSTFSQEIQDELTKFESSGDSDKTSVPLEEPRTSVRVWNPETEAVLAEHAQRHSKDVASMATGSDLSTHSSHPIRSSDDSQRHLLTASSNSEHDTTASPNSDPASTVKEQDTTGSRHSDPLSPVDEPNITLSPNPDLASPPKIGSAPPSHTPVVGLETLMVGIQTPAHRQSHNITPPGTGEQIERMNELNEQDPAFKKTVEALRTHSNSLSAEATNMATPKTTKHHLAVSATKIPSPKTGTQGVAHARLDNGGKRPRVGTLKKYFGFAKRFRGHED